MNQSIDLYDYQQQAGQALGSNQLANYQGLLGYSSGCYIQQIPVSRPMAQELTIHVAAGKVYLDYGEDIRLLMAEPVKGMKLREAVQLLKEALCKQDQHQ